MNDVEKMFLEGMKQDRFQSVISDNKKFACADRLIETRDINRALELTRKKED